MQKTILTIIFALLLALTSWAQKFTISGDLSVMTSEKRRFSTRDTTFL